MKEWEDVIKERLAGRKAELPESDWNDFLSRKAEHERAARRRYRMIAAAISFPAAAAVLLLMLLPFNASQNNEVAVNAVVAKVQSVSDSTQFNMAAYRLPEGTSVEDLIRNLPGVKVDSAGNITVNGKAVNRILVNGKEFFNENNEKSLTQLTAEMIEKVKAYEKNSDLSRQTGYDDGREETVLDLVSVRGKVYDSETAEPLSNASVQIYRVTREDTTFICGTLTRQDGSFLIYNLERGKYVARASLEDYINGESRFKVRSGYKANNRVKIAIRRVDR